MKQERDRRQIRMAKRLPTQRLLPANKSGALPRLFVSYCFHLKYDLWVVLGGNRVRRCPSEFNPRLASHRPRRSKGALLVESFLARFTEWGCPDLMCQWNRESSSSQRLPDVSQPRLPFKAKLRTTPATRGGRVPFTCDHRLSPTTVSGMVRVSCQLGHKRKEPLGLANKKPHLR